ncbi:MULTISPECIES: AI-2E family transporter [Streptomyces]|uniref:AI-2E family transporter n=1 Tax=Streptomyces yunnanensis TaxID=156453 RepID=A0ABY8A2G6_9ACTN|nr:MULTISPECIES: AI-2E family transporter [Streptomyces]AJC53484.1 integral membrane protein [Streptomyces sp. 769]WEB38496.1 AI-2E family transporter [Streptomyces yunnanensis]
MAAAYGWRLLVVGAAVYVVFVVLGRFHLVTLAVFLGLVLTALLEPLTNLLGRWLPRAGAVTAGLLLGILLLFGVLSLMGANVADEWPGLRLVFTGGVARIERWLEGPPFHLQPGSLSHLQEWISHFVSTNRANLINTAVSGVGRLAEVLTVGVLALFCSVFFLHSGARMWLWFGGQLPERGRRPVGTAGRAAWTTFTGYTRGIVLIAATNAVLVGVALFVLGVPLVLPLAVLEFFAAFVPLIGSPVALAVAAVVALAAKGPLVALLVILLIVLIGQLEGHVLHPVVMSRAVSLHPMVVALAVVCGGVTAGVLGAVVAVPLVSVVWSVYGALRSQGRPG